MSQKEKELFNKIANNYLRKDLYPVSQMARKFQLYSLLRSINKEYFENILDVGCGPGFNAKYLSNKYGRYTGVDFSKEFITIAKKLHPDQEFLQCDIKNISLVYNEEPDLILGVGVLHHIDNLDQALKSMREISTNNTLFAFVEPFRGNSFIKLLRYIRKRIDRTYSKDQVFFSRKELEDLFERNGYRLLKIRYQGYFSTPFAQIILRPWFIFSPICWATIKVDTFIQKYLNNPLSWNIQVYATLIDEKEKST